VLGKRATVIYLGTIAVFSLAFGLALDRIYLLFNISPQAVIGQAGELIPVWAQWTGAIILLLLSIRPLKKTLVSWFGRKRETKCGNASFSQVRPSDTVIGGPAGST